MSATPKRVFLSHTAELRELPRERSYAAAAEAAIIRAGHAVVNMAYFAAQDAAPADYCTAMVATADIYVGIIGWRYGTTVSDRPDLSYTELEFDTATALRLPRLLFLLQEDPDPTPPPDPYRDRQEAFRDRLQANGLVMVAVGSPAEFELALFQALVVHQEDAYVSARRTSQPAVRSGRTISSPDQLDHATIRLADIVRAQWQTEMGLRQLNDPHPLSLRWRRADQELMDHPELVFGYRSAQLGGPQGRALPSSGRTDALFEVFRRLPSRRLVVLGPPGAGKTGLLVLLTLRLLTGSRPGEPTPLLFSMSSWNPEVESLTDWARHRIMEDYPALRVTDAFGGTAIADLVEHGRVMLLLDGLDEMPERLRLTAIQELNRSAVGMPLVIASRKEEYARAVRMGDVLTAAAVIELEPVEAGEAANLLRLTVPPRSERETRWLPVLARLVQDPGGPLAAALSTPLMVWLARTAYASGEHDPAELLDETRFASAPAIDDHLLDAIVPATYGGSRPEERWLAFLASELSRRGTRDIAWWELPASAPGVLPGLLVGLMVALALGAGDPVLGLAAGVLVWLAVGPVFESHAPQPSRVTLRLDRATVQTFLGRTGLGLALGLALSVVPVVVLELDPLIGVGIGGGGGLALGGVYGIAGALAPGISDEVASPTSTLRADRLACLLYAGMSALAVSLILAFSFIIPPLEAAALVLASGVVASLLTAWPRYRLALGWLAVRGRLPWRLSGFLVEAHRRGLLRQVGAVYQFRHARLQDRLAGGPALGRRAR